MKNSIGIKIPTFMIDKNSVNLESVYHIDEDDGFSIIEGSKKSVNHIFKEILADFTGLFQYLKIKIDIYQIADILGSYYRIPVYICE